MFNSGFRGKRAKDGEGTVGQQVQYIQTSSPQPSISGWTISDTDDVALDPAGGQTVLVNGGGFASGCSVTVNGITISPVTLVSPTQISFTSPALSGGSYSLIVYNSSGGAAILVPGLTYSSVPAFTTSAGSIGTVYETKPISTSVVATSDSSLTYSLASGSLPTGATLYANGVISGTAPVDSSSTTYTFSVTATDAELQDVTRTFTLTINTDVVSWVTPSSGSTITLDGTAYSQSLSASDAAGYAVSYTANSLPTGLSLSSGTISGTPTVDGTSSTLLTATAATTGRSSTNTVTWVVALGDTYFKYTSLLLSANGSIQTSSFVSDASINNAQLAVVGDTKAQNFNPYQHGYYSYQFNGSTDVLTVSRSGGWLTSGNNFTMEFWGCLTGYSSNYSGTYLSCPFGTSAASNGFEHGFSGTASSYTAYVFTWKGLGSVTATYTFNLNTWYHIAIVKNGSTTTIYINGVSSATTTSFTSWTDNASMNIGELGVSGWNFWYPGYISNLRIVDGTAVYTSNFTPSTTPLNLVPNTVLLTAQSTRFVDGTINNYAFTVTSAPKVTPVVPFTRVYQAGEQYYSTYFDGTGDYLTIANNSVFNFNANDFTIECWVYPTAAGTLVGFIQQWQTGGQFIFRRNTSNRPEFVYDMGSTITIVGTSTTINANVWSHVAVVRYGSTIKMYVNGVADAATSTFAGSLLTTNRPVKIGVEGDLNGPLAGYISNARIVNGTAIYTSNFTPSTIPLTAVANTVLLTCKDNVHKDSSTNNFTITVTGDAKPVRTSPFTPSSYTNTEITTYGSGYFSATSAYTTYSPANTDVFGTGDFTVECWLNPTSTTAVNISMASTATSTWELLTYSNQLYWHENGGNLGGTGYGSIPLNSWSHLAVCRSGTTLKMFINGVQVYSVTNSYNYSASPATRSIGPYNGGSAPYYLSDFRIVKGTALYTSNFVPQFTSPLSNVTNTQLLTLQTNGSHNNNVFKDQSSFNNVVTRNGNVTNGTFSPYGDNWSNYFSSATLATPATHTVFAAANEDFTVECWFYLTSSPGTHSMIAGYNVSPWDYWEVNTTGMGLNMNNNYNAGCLYTFALNTWYHVAFSRVSNSIKCYVNGVWQSTNTVTNSFGVGTAILKLGNWCTTPNYYFPGYISNFRFIKGTGLYTTTTSFVVPTSPLTAVSKTTLLTCQSNGFVDNSLNQYLLTNTSATTSKFSPFSTLTVPKYYSTYFNGSTDYLSITSQATLALGSGDFTVEFWYYNAFAALPSNYTLYDQRNGTNGVGVVQPVMEITSASGIAWYVTAENKITSTSTPIKFYTWQHLAVSRVSGSTRMFIDGTQVGSTYTDSNDYPAGSIYIGKANDGASARYYLGYISNVRVLVGTGLYSTTFTPSTTPLTAITNTRLLTCQSNTNIDNSSNYLTITGNGSVKPLPVSPFTPTASTPVSYSTTTFGGSMYFDGTGDYLSIAVPNSFNNVTTRAMTIEFWSYPTVDNFGVTFGFFGYGTTSNGYSLTIDANRWVLKSANGTDNNVYVVAAATVPMPKLNTWTHYAVVFKSTGTVDVIINGIKNAALTGGSSLTSSVSNGTFTVGSAYNGAYMHFGYISDFRVTLGAALYLDNFYPGSTPLTPTTTIGTSTYSAALLLNGTSSGVLDATRTVDLETVGDAKVTNFSPYNGGYYSNYFNGTDAYMTAAHNTSLDLGTGNFTIEFWLNPVSWSSGTAGVVGKKVNDSSNGWQIYRNSTNPTKMSARLTQQNDFYTTSTIDIGVWTHWALVRTGSTLYWFKNGVLDSTGSSSADITDTSASLYIGFAQTWSAYGNFSISNLRIVKGTALYTSSFTPSTTPLTAIANTSFLTCQFNKFVDNSTNNFGLTLSGPNTVKVQTQNPFQVNTGLSYYFDGTGDYLKTSTSVAIQFTSTGPLTFECWFYKTVSTGATEQSILGASTSGSLTIDISNASVWIGRNSVAFITQPAYTEQLGQWVHLAVTRGSSNDYRVFINGSQIGTTVTDSNSLPDSATWYIGQNGSLARPFYGYITDVRFTRGVARYTTTFTPPTAPVKTN